MKQAYPAEIIKDEQGRYFVRFLDFAEAITEGESLQEALANAQEVLALTLEARRAEGLPIPKAQPAAGENIHFIAMADQK
jgi:antitoxin HicB